MKELRRFFRGETSSGGSSQYELKREAVAVKFYNELPQLGLEHHQLVGELAKIGNASAGLVNLTSDNLGPHLEIVEGRVLIVLSSPRVRLGGVTSLKIGLENSMNFSDYSGKAEVRLVPYIHFADDRNEQHPSRFAQKHGIMGVSFYLMTSAQAEELRTLIGEPPRK